MKNFLLISAIILLTVFTSLGQTNYYVSITGDNSNSGITPNQAWQSINYAAQNSIVVAGDTVHIIEGIYNEQVNFAISGDINMKITFRNYQDDEVILSGSTLPSNEYIMKIEDQKYIRIVGLKFKDYQALNAIGLIVINSSFIHVEDNEFANIDYSATAIGEIPTENQNSQPIIIYGRGTDSINVSQDLNFIGNSIHDCETGWSEALSINGNVDEFEIAYNEIFNNTNIGIVAIGYEGECPNPGNDQPRNGHIHHNIVHNNPSAYSKCAGIYLDGAAQMNIENNILYNNDYGIEVGCENNGNIPGANANSIIVRNNLIYNNTFTGIALGGYNYPTTGYVEYIKISNNTLFNNDTENNYQGEMMISYTEYAIIENNIIYANNVDNVLFTYANPSLTLMFDYNLFYTKSGTDNIVIEWNGMEFNTFEDYRSVTVQDINSIFTKPIFVEGTVANPDLHLHNLSPAINAGNPTTLPEGYDMDDEDRINQNIVDIGADEYYLITSSFNHDTKNEILCYPNPTMGKLNIVLSEKIIKNVKVLDLTGKVIIAKTTMEQNELIDLSGYKSGIYIISIQIENEIFTEKIIKE